MKSVTIYTTPTCPYCIRAKALFTELNIPYTEVDVASDTAKREEIIEKFNWQTVPAIFFDETLVGGFDDVNKLHQSGELMALLEA